MMERIVIEVHSQAEKEALIDELEAWGYAERGELKVWGMGSCGKSKFYYK